MLLKLYRHQCQRLHTLRINTDRYSNTNQCSRCHRYTSPPLVRTFYKNTICEQIITSNTFKPTISGIPYTNSSKDYTVVAAIFISLFLIQDDFERQNNSSNVTFLEGEMNANNNHNNDTALLHSPIIPIRIIRPNPFLEICYDTRTRNPIYVQYKLQFSTSSTLSDDDIGVDGDGEDDTTYIDINNTTTNQQLLETNTSTQQQQQLLTVRSKKKQPKYHFYEDTRHNIEEIYRSKNIHYHNSGYDRGHLAPAADFNIISKSNSNNSDISNTTGKNSLVQDTYNLCNISPQYPEFNRYIWNILEQFIRQFAKDQTYNTTTSTSSNKNHIKNVVTYITTGPIYLPSSIVNNRTSNDNDDNNKQQFQYNIIGIGVPPSIVMVPTHFFKVVLIVDESEGNNNNNNHGNILYFGCFVIPNTPHRQHDMTIQDYIVPWTRLEAVTGLQFYPNLINDTFKAYADELTQQTIQQGKSSSSSSSLISWSNRPSHGNVTTPTTSTSPSLLLLTDGKAQPRHDTAYNKKNHRQLQKYYNNTAIQHICANQACLLPRIKQQQQQQQQRKQ